MSIGNFRNDTTENCQFVFRQHANHTSICAASCSQCQSLCCASIISMDRISGMLRFLTLTYISNKRTYLRPEFPIAGFQKVSNKV